MTTTIYGHPDLLGTPLLKVRNLLRAWMRSDIETAASFPGVGLPLPDALAIASEIASQGFLHPEGPFDPRDRDDPMLTMRGLALAAATTRRRAPLSRAETLVARVVDRAMRSNADPDRLHDIRTVWLFGSAAAGRETVGDVDVAVEAVPSRRLLALLASGDPAELRRAASTRLPPSLARSAATEDLPRLVVERVVHGGRLDPLLSVHDVELLTAMHAPCRLVMDAEGPVDGPLLPHHPASTGMGAGFMERRVLHVPKTPPLPGRLSMRGIDRYAWRWSPVYESAGLPDAGMRSHALFRAASVPAGSGLLAPEPLAELDPGPEEYVVARLGAGAGLSYEPVGTIGHESSFAEGKAAIGFATRTSAPLTRAETVSCARHVSLAAAAALRYGRMCRPDLDWTLTVSASDPEAAACLDEAETMAERLPGWLDHGPDKGHLAPVASTKVSWERDAPSHRF